MTLNSWLFWLSITWCAVLFGAFLFIIFAH
jgi:hypothetical protein